METPSRRGLLRPQESPIQEIMVDLAAALVGTGSALAFGEISAQDVPEKVAVVISTSGSTAAPKEVGISAKALLASAKASNKFLGAKFGQVWSLLLPIHHVAGINVLVRSLELGTTPIDLRDATTYPHADFTAIVPTQLFRALNGDAPLLEHLQSCQAVLVGGAALTKQLHDQATSQGIKVISTYGMTETCGGCVYDGHPLEGVEVKTEDEIIKIKGGVLAYSYLNDEEACRSSFEDGWFVTSDRGSFVDGKLTVFGRADDVMISGGEKLSLKLIEETLHSHFTKNEFSAFAVPDAEWGSALHVAIAGQDALSTQDATAYLEEKLGSVAKPKGFLILPELPMIGVGKVDQKALVEEVLRGKAL